MTQSIVKATVINELEVPTDLQRAQWLGLTIAPGFEYGPWWFEFGSREMDYVIASFQEMHNLGLYVAEDGYYPPLMAEHEEHVQPYRAGDIRDLKKWEDPRTGYLWFVALVQWTPKGWEEVQAGAHRYISPHYGPVTDGQGNWWDLGLREVSTAVRPLQRQIGSIQSWARRSGVAASQTRRLYDMSKANKGAANTGAQNTPSTPATTPATPPSSVKANTETDDLRQMMGELMAKMNDMTGEVAKLRARVDAARGGGEDTPQEPEEPEAGGGEDKPEGEDKPKEQAPAASASSNMDARVARLELQLRTERRRTALASLPADNAAGYTAADAEDLAEMPDKAFSKLMDRLRGTQASTPTNKEKPPTPAPGSVFTRSQAPAASASNGGNAPTTRASGDDEERLRDEAWTAAEARASALKAEGKSASMMDLYAEEKAARGCA